MRKVWKGMLSVIGVLLIMTGLGILTMQFVKPDVNEKILYGAKTKVEAQIVKVKEEVTGEYPTINIKQGTSLNDAWELDNTTNHEFVLMESYKQVPTVLPLYAAHNGLGGSKIIEWGPGQKVNIVGDNRDGVYVIAEEMTADKFGTVDQAEPLQNADFILQTCYWGEPYVKFISLVPEAEYEKGWPPKKDVEQSQDTETLSVDRKPVQLVTED